jgi:hypothetical protein
MRNPTAVSAEDRQCFIGGSDARIIMGNDEAALLRLWREKLGQPVLSRRHVRGRWRSLSTSCARR